MIGISKLFCSSIEPSDVLRYGRHSSKLPSNLLQFSEDKRPVVIMNITKRCNLRCVHCYAGSNGFQAKDELSTSELLKVIDDLADFKCPVVLFSGGEPLTHPDIVPLARHAVEKGMRAVISTNGTLISSSMAENLSTIGLSYIGASLDGGQEIHDRFRGVEGSFERTIRGLSNAREAGIKTGIRFTITKRNMDEIPKIFELLERERIPRICFYHLVYTGRGEDLMEETLSHKETRTVVDTIIDHTIRMHENGNPVEVLTVDNHCDGPYLYLRMLRENKKRAEEILELLKFNAGNSSGLGVSAISWDGSVLPDQFWRNKVLGNIRQKSFSEIWIDQKNEFLMKLKDKKKFVTGRCSRCRFLDVCGGNLRARAEAAAGDTWASDPACYLTDREIGIE